MNPLNPFLIYLSFIFAGMGVAFTFEHDWRMLTGAVLGFVVCWLLIFILFAIGRGEHPEPRATRSV